ncbi:MAG: hypothetical protein AAF518_27085, partial [Spirochaetota bacterium]
KFLLFQKGFDTNPSKWMIFYNSNFHILRPHCKVVFLKDFLIKKLHFNDDLTVCTKMWYLM